MNLKEIKTTPYNGSEKFFNKNKSLEFSILDFWAWNQSDLIENRNRGILAEFLVRQALSIKSPTRLEWDAYDLTTDEGYKIEVKSAAFIQAWEQTRYSTISFDIKPTSTYRKNNTYSSEKKRHSDLYIFCLLNHKDQTTINPLNTEQWSFYLVPTAELDTKIPNQKSIAISTIEMLNHEVCKHEEINSHLKKLLSTK